MRLHNQQNTHFQYSRIKYPVHSPRLFQELEITGQDQCNPNNRDWWLISGKNITTKWEAGQEHKDDPTTPTFTQTTTNFVPYVQQDQKVAHVAWKTTRCSNLNGIFGGLIDGAYTPYQAPKPICSTM